ncbi:MAG TPA: hypothetical protein VGR96_20210 [Acidobacteriaceae bacterium]|nr:hypothetical protein [Acidobacteriaceae bacterium]
MNRPRTFDIAKLSALFAALGTQFSGAARGQITTAERDNARPQPAGIFRGSAQ